MKLYENEKLSKYNWFNSGGPAELFYKAYNQVELASFLKHIKSFNKTINIILKIFHLKMVLTQKLMLKVF